MIHYFKIFLVLSILGSLCSCAKFLSDDNNERLPKMRDDDIKLALDSLSGVSFQYFYSKLSTHYKDSSLNRSFKSSVRISQDSAINVLITFAKIPGFNSLVTKDSVQFYMKPDKCYTKESLRYLRTQFGVDFSYRNIEELFFGLPLGFKPEEDYFRINDPFSYRMCSHRKREIKKNERNDVRELITYYSLSKDLKTLKSIWIESPEDSALVQIDYIELELIDGYNVPKEVEIKITTPRKDINLRLEYKKTRVNDFEQIYFVIPENYDACE